MSEIKQYDTEVRLEAVMGTNHYGVHIHAMTAENLHSKSDIAVELAWRDLRIEQLIAQLEAAQKERDVYANLASDVGDIITLLQNNEWAEQVGKTNVGGLLEYQITQLVNSIADINTKLLAAEVALSAANEKLKGEQVPVAVIVLSKNWPDTGRKVIDYYIEKIQHLPVGTELFTAPQKPVVLSSSTVMSRAYVVQAIKAAGFTVEGE
ncbi:TPA: hypothetical protein ACPZRP_004020 [Yersinia enterocolitica]